MNNNTSVSGSTSNQNRALRLKFTVEAFDQLPIPEEGQGRIMYYDAKTSGLVLSVSATGKKVFHFYRKVKNVPRRLQIGPFPEWTIDQARRQAAKYNAEVARGIPPGEEQREALRVLEAEKHRKSMILTFGELFDKYYADHSKPRKRSCLEDKQKYERHLESGKWGINITDRLITEIEKSDIARIHIEFGKKHPTSANRLLALISSVFGKAIAWGDFKGANPCEKIERFRETPRKRFLQPDELPRLFRALDMEENETVRDFVYLCLFTGARRSNVLTMKWDEISFDRSVWQIDMTKNGEPQTVPLVDEVIALLKARKVKAAAKDEFVLPGSGKKGRLVEPKFVWKRILNRATAIGLLDKICEAQKLTVAESDLFQTEKLAAIDASVPELIQIAKALKIQLKPLDMRDLHVHDLRRTMGSWQANTGASLPIIGRSLNHKSSQSTQVYAHLMIDPVRRSMQRATSAMLTGSIEQQRFADINANPSS